MKEDPELKSDKSMAKELRRAKTACPVCAQPLDGWIEQRGKEVYLCRECPEHGPREFLLSTNGDLYADLDRFYCLLKGDKTQGRITNYWVLSTSRCQMRCAFCQAEVESPIFKEMSQDDFEHIFSNYGDAKLTLSGGEPSLHPQVLNFFEEAKKRNLTTQLATNGVRLADEAFVRRLVEAHVEEVRLSIESFEAHEAAVLGTDSFVEPKLKALSNLEKHGIAVILSPTIFKGVNEHLLIDCLDYARDRAGVKEISVNGFSWVGEGVGMDKAKMIMPDEMMDVLFQKYFDDDREEIFTFQKLMLSILQVLGIRLCFYTQLMIFVKEEHGIVPITKYFHMGRMKRAFQWWERVIERPAFVQGLATGLVLMSSLKLSSFKIFRSLVSVLLASIFKLDFKRYPKNLIPVVLNTNCSTLTVDECVSRQCMSGCLFKDDDKINEDRSTYLLMDKERRRVASHSSGPTQPH
jgi:molybdenum cofactor biosynthesis enzyme MoaA